MHSTTALTFVASILAAVSASPIAERANAQASVTLLPGKCGSGTTGLQSNVDMASGGKTGCVSVSTPFSAFIAEGQYLGYKLWSDAKCTKQVEISKEEGKDNCYNIKEGKGYAYSYTY